MRMGTIGRSSYRHDNFEADSGSDNFSNGLMNGEHTGGRDSKINLHSFHQSV
jgi:hypothetical protein